jgi:hypothetical protein
MCTIQILRAGHLLSLLGLFELIGQGSERKDRVANGQLQVMTAIHLQVSYRPTQPAPRPFTGWGGKLSVAGEVSNFLSPISFRQQAHTC